MKKLGYLLFITAFLLLGLATTAFLCRAQLLTYLLSSALDSPVHIKTVTLCKTGAVIKGLTLQNPPDCSMKDALQVDTITLQFHWEDLFKALFIDKEGKIVIDSIKIDKPDMLIEIFTITGSDTNWSRILNKIATPSSTPSTLEFQIKKLTLTNILLEARYHAITKKIFKPAPIAKIELNNIGSDHGVDAKSLFYIVSKVLTKEAMAQFDLKTTIPEMIIEHVIPLPILEIKAAQALFDMIHKKLTKPSKQEPHK